MVLDTYVAPFGLGFLHKCGEWFFTACIGHDISSFSYGSWSGFSTCIVPF